MSENSSWIQSSIEKTKWNNISIEQSVVSRIESLIQGSYCENKVAKKDLESHANDLLSEIVAPVLEDDSS